MGRYVHQMHEYVISYGGITIWTNYLYIDAHNKCDRTKENKTITSIKGYNGVGGEAGLRAAVAKQPVAVAVEAMGNDFRFYCGGSLMEPVVLTPTMP